MDSAIILTTILLVGLLIGMFMNFLIQNIITQVQHLKAIFENNREFKAKEAAVAKMKAGGDMHEWISVPLNGAMTHVCKKTGYVPSINGFLPMQYINQYLENLKAEEEYKVFRADRIYKIAQKYDLDVPKTEEIVEKIFSMKKDFALMRIERLQKEMQDRSAAVKNEQGQV